MNKIISYTVANTNMVSGQIVPGQTVNIDCPLDATGNTPQAILFQSTGWLEVYVYSGGQQTGILHVNGMLSVICPKSVTKISLENRHSTVPLMYYITPLDGL